MATFPRLCGDEFGIWKGQPIGSNRCLDRFSGILSGFVLLLPPWL